MELIASPLLWIVLALSVGIPALFIIGARHVAYRLVGRPDTVPVTVAEASPIPSLHFRSRFQALRTLVLLLLLGTGTGIILLRYGFGIGAVTHLSDQFPWGLWIGFDVMGGVALAAGAFVIVATVHIFGLRRFEPLVRPAILTGLLGYLLVMGALLVDLGRPYNFWQPLVHWQHHSVMWEVGLCVVSYTAVLLIEFLPVILERINTVQFITVRLPTRAFYHHLRKVSIVFVITGVVLSTLHQSSLGSLWVLVPEKLHPLWYSLYLPVFFWLSAVAGGLAMIVVESTLSSKVFRRGLELDLLAELAKAASVVLFIYLAARAADIIVRGYWPLFMEPTIQAGAFWVEMGLGVLAPALLFAIGPLRRKPLVLFSTALMVVLFGVILNRLNVSIIGLWSYTGNVYFPSWMEFVVTITLVSLGVIAFGLAARYLPVFDGEKEQAVP
jgi:Ni/Fe-hydrogenase subunit HybB-like protein